MKKYKKGDICPLCGQIIQTDDPDMLWLIGALAPAIQKNSSKIRASAPETVRCTIHYCRSRSGDFCCSLCPTRDKCPEVCLNAPERCGCAAK